MLKLVIGFIGLYSCLGVAPVSCPFPSEISWWPLRLHGAGDVEKLFPKNLSQLDPSILFRSQARAFLPVIKMKPCTYYLRS